MFDFFQLKSSTKALIFSFLNGLCMGLIWPPSKCCVLVPVSMVPMVWFWLRNINVRNSWLIPYFFFLSFTLISVRWLWQIEGGAEAKGLTTLAFLLIPFVQAIPFIISGILVRKTGLYFMFMFVPFLAVAVEVLHNYWDLGFTWLHMYLGLSGSPIHVGSYALVGAVGTSFLLYLSNVLFAAAIYFRRKNSLKWSNLVVAITCVLLLFLPNGSVQKEMPGKAFKIAVAEPVYDPGQWDKRELYKHSRNIGEAIQIASDLEVGLVVFPEGYLRDFGNNPILLNDFHLNPAIRDVQSWCSEYGVHVITGAIGIMIYDSNSVVPTTARQNRNGVYYEQYNLVLCISPSGEIQYRAKSRLVPFMERVPFLSTFSSLEKLHLKLNQSGGSYAKGNGLSTFQVDGLKILPLICYENLFQSDLSSELVTNSDLIIEISNEAWARGAYMARQHYTYGHAVSSIVCLPYARSSVAAGAGFFNLGKQSIVVPASFGSLWVVQ